jgi:hypothetical protein
MNGLIPRSLPAAAAAALLTAACNVTLYLDDARLEQTIRDGIESQSDLSVTQVNCPDKQPIKEGDVFECTADTSDGRHLTVTITQTDSSGGVHWEVTSAS